MKYRIKWLFLDLFVFFFAPKVLLADASYLYQDEIKDGQSVGTVNRNAEAIYRGKLDLRPRDVVPFTPDKYSLGNSTYTWANLYVSSITATYATITSLTVTNLSVTSNTATGYVVIVDTKTQNTDGGSFTNGDWRTRTLTVETVDANNDASLASNQITLVAGTYDVFITAPAYKVNRHQARLRNVTGGVTLLTGTSSVATDGSDVQNTSVIIGRITIAASQALEVQHHCETSIVNTGFGLAGNFSTEIYTIATFRRVN